MVHSLGGSFDVSSDIPPNCALLEGPIGEAGCGAWLVEPFWGLALGVTFESFRWIHWWFQWWPTKTCISWSFDWMNHSWILHKASLWFQLWPNMGCLAWSFIWQVRLWGRLMRPFWGQLEAGSSGAVAYMPPPWQSMQGRNHGAADKVAAGPTRGAVRRGW